MQYRKFGSLNFEVSALGFGAMRLPGRRLSLMGADFKESIKIMRSAIDQGINYIDTAWFYHLGESEKVLGQTLQDGYREKVKLVTKLPMPLLRTRADFDRFLHNQLERLQTEHIDLYQIHSMDAGQFDKLKRLGLMEKMEEAQRQGKIGHIGFSFHDTLPVYKEIIDYYDWDMTQIQLNYMDTGYQAGIEGMKYAHSKDIAVVVMEPLRGGLLANPPAEAMEIINKAPVKRSPVDWAFQFVWNMPEVATVLSGMSDQRMVDEDCEFASNSGPNTLTPEEVKVIEQLAAIYKKRVLVDCTACEYCMPCPEGVNIPQNFAILNNLSMTDKWYKKFMVRRDYKKLTGSLDSLDLDNPNGNAAICTICGECLPKCPQNIEIPDELEKVHAILGEGDKINKHFGE